jgi:hypothetical protein
LSEKDIDYLKPVAESVQALGFTKIKAWYSMMGIREHIEASMIFNLMGLLDALQLPYFEPKAR